MTIFFYITIEPGYKDIGLYVTSFIALDILWYQLIPYCWPQCSITRLERHSYTAIPCTSFSHDVISQFDYTLKGHFGNPRTMWVGINQKCLKGIQWEVLELFGLSQDRAHDGVLWEGQKLIGWYYCQNVIAHIFSYQRFKMDGVKLIQLNFPVGFRTLELFCI